MEESFLILLSRIPGVGKKKAKSLIAEGFSSVDSILSAKVEEIAIVAGIGWELATRIKEFFEEKFLQEVVPFVCPVCGSIVRTDETRCPSCATILPARKEVEIETLDRLLEELERGVQEEEEATKRVERAKEEQPRVLARDFLERWSRVQEGEELPRAQKLEEKIRHYERLLEVDPTLERAWLKKAELLIELGRYDEAIECYDRASELNPEMEDQYKIEVLNILRSKEDVALVPEPAEEIAGEDIEAIERAIRHYDALLRLDPTLKMAWQTKGELLEKLGRHDEAVDCYGKAIGTATLDRVRDIRKMATLNTRDIWSRRSVSKGLINGLGRTNGLVNGLVNGKVNGLVNGLGKVNGLVNGLVNGVGRGNGLVNGLINGNGLVNGRASRVRQIEIPRGPARWSRGLVGIAALLTLLVLMPMLGSFVFVSEKPVIEIDGDFNDWYGLPTKSSPVFIDGSQDQLQNADVNLISYRLFRESSHFYLFAEVEGIIFNGTGENGLDNLFVFLDTDGNSSSGYGSGGMGVDRMIRLSGWNNTCARGYVFEFSPTRGRDNWYGFQKTGSVSCSVDLNRLEASFQLPVPEARTLLATSDVFGHIDVGDSVISTDRGALTVDVETIAPEVINRSEFPVLSLTLRIQATTLTDFTLDFSKQGNLSDEMVTVALYRDSNDNGAWDTTDLRMMNAQMVDGSASFRLNMSASPLEGNISLFAVVQLPSMPEGYSFGLRLEEVIANATTMIREGFVTNSYILSPPDVTIDGAFADWIEPFQPDFNDDVTRIVSANATMNENIDLLNYSSRRAETVSFYLEIDRLGRMLGGDLIPALYERPEPYVPSYLDSDRDSVPDQLDGPGGIHRFDFDNDGVADVSEGGDVDSDGELDYPFGDDFWLETTIPSNYTEPYANQSVRIYIGPLPAKVTEGLDRAVLYLDRDGPGTGLRTIVDGQLVGYDFMFLITGKGGRINSTGLYVYNESSSIPWDLSSTLEAAIDSYRMELGAPAQLLNLTDDFVAHVYLIDWSKTYDRSDLPLTNSTTRSRTRSPEGDNVVINEIRPDKKNNEWIELANPTDGEIDISGWELVLDGTTIYTFPQGTTIGAFGSGSEYLVVDFSGDTIPDGGGNLKLANGTTDIDETDYPSLKVPESWSRYRESETGKPIDNNDPDDWYVSTSPTKGEQNDRTKPSMIVTKVADKTSAAPGEQVTYTIYYNNTGSSKVRNVWINDTLPDGVTFVSSSKDYTSRNGNTYRWFINVVPRKSENSLTVTVQVNDTVDDETILTNFVTLNYTNDDGVWQPGSDSNVSFTCARPVIAVVKTVDLSEAQPGDWLNYTVYYNNTGSANASHVWVNDTLPDYVTYQSSSEPYESQSGNTYVWHFTDVAPGSHSFTITVTIDLDVPPGITLVNWAFLNYTTQNSYPLEESWYSASTYIPEFQDLIVPLLTVLGVFVIVRRRRVADGVPRANDR
ncbi:MAG: lamin tail domain-containing protein [Thermoplasmata archaeon]